MAEQEGQSSQSSRSCEMGSSSNEELGIGNSSFVTTANTKPHSRTCGSPLTSIVGSALNQMNLKRSSSAPMINQLVPQGEFKRLGAATSTATLRGIDRANSHDVNAKEASPGSVTEAESSSYANGFLASLSDSRPRRFSASFSPHSPGLAPNRVSQLRQENSSSTDWESASEKEFHGNVNIAQSWEDLSLDSMSMEVSNRRPSFSDQLWLSMPTTSLSASSSPTASPKIMSRFSPSLSSPSPTRKSFTSRRSLSPIAIRPSVLAIGQGVKRKCDWDSNQMDCSPVPAKRPGGLLSVQQYHPPPATISTSTLAIAATLSAEHHMRHTDSPNSIETESSISSNGDSPFFRPVDSPQTTDDITFQK